VWQQNDAQKFRELIIHSQEENVRASGISRGRPSPNAVSHVFAAQANTEHTVFLQEVGLGPCVVNCSEKWPTRVNLESATHKEAC
jgi:hypothetical protein